MPELQDFIQSAMKSLGTTEQTTRSATGGVLQLIKQYAGQGDFKEILDKVPGTEALLKEAPSAAPEAKGGLGGLFKNAASLFGGKAGAAVGVLDMIQKSGLDTSSIGKFLPLFMTFLKSKVGSELVGRVVDKVPELKKLIG